LVAVQNDGEALFYAPPELQAGLASHETLTTSWVLWVWWSIKEQVTKNEIEWWDYEIQPEQNTQKPRNQRNNTWNI
jgi:hypothetical protein